MQARSQRSWGGRTLSQGPAALEGQLHRLPVLLEGRQEKAADEATAESSCCSGGRLVESLGVADQWCCGRHKHRALPVCRQGAQDDTSGRRVAVPTSTSYGVCPIASGSVDAAPGAVAHSVVACVPQQQQAA
jgi:hypothetical protein